MQWFKHDTTAYTDARIKKLVIRYGAEGYAIYFHCLELIAGDISDTNLTFELEHDAEIIADNLKIKSTPDVAAIDKVNEIMMYIIELGLFESTDYRVFCFKLLKRLDTSMTGNTHMRQMIVKAKELNHDKIMTESCKKRVEEIREDKKREDIYYMNQYFSVTTSKHFEYREIYYNIDIDMEYKKMKLWLDDNPKKQKKRYGQFIVNWLNNAVKNTKNIESGEEKGIKNISEILRGNEK